MSKATWEDTPFYRRLLARLKKDLPPSSPFPGFTAAETTGYGSPGYVADSDTDVYIIVDDGPDLAVGRGSDIGTYMFATTDSSSLGGWAFAGDNQTEMQSRARATDDGRVEVVSDSRAAVGGHEGASHVRLTATPQQQTAEATFQVDTANAHLYASQVPDGGDGNPASGINVDMNSASGTYVTLQSAGQTMLALQGANTGLTVQGAPDQGQDLFGVTTDSDLFTIQPDGTVLIGETAQLVLHSANGSKHRIAVADDGTLSTTVVT